MSTTLFVYSTYERARHKFTEFLSLHDPNNILASVSPSRLQIEVNSKTYEFTWLDGVNDKIRGRTFSSIIVEELVALTPEQDSLLKSRKREYL
jgi:hypothetical protein